MRVTVLGAGAVGSVLGGLIKQHDPTVEVLFIGRGEHGQAVRNAGHVVLEGRWGSSTVPVDFSVDVAQLAGSDLVLLTVKSQDTEEAIRAASPYLGRATLVSIQNGINHPLLLQFVARDRLVLGMTAANMAIRHPGCVSLQLDGATIVGTPPGEPATPALALAVEVLNRSGLRILAHPNVLGLQYNKLVINALGYASCLSATRFITDGILHPPWRHAVGIPLLDECTTILHQAAIPLARARGVPGVHSFRKLLNFLSIPLIGPSVGSFARRILLRRKPIVFSLSQDLLRSKRTEIDAINGEFVRLARQHGAEAPFNALVVDLVHQLEQRGGGTFFSREDVIEQFRLLAATQFRQMA